ncbi:MAG: hypothetical protein KDD45_01890 [Bdellovibrionales bacterium]|nr:hypothetical protein [Bdellovibrionales bacterium]
MLKKVLVVILFMIGMKSQAGLLFNYHQLAMKDLDQMNSLVQNKIKESQKAYGGKAIPLKEALQAVYSRPNHDDMITKVVDPLRSQLDRLDVYEKSFTELIQEAINVINHSKNFKKEVQVTYSIFLENVVAEFKPNIKDDAFEMKMIKKIADAKLVLSTDAKKERELRLMDKGSSPSELAQLVLDEYQKAKDEAAKKANPIESPAENDSNSSEANSIDN